jgi:hypothetical protein
LDIFIQEIELQWMVFRLSPPLASTKLNELLEMNRLPIVSLIIITTSAFAQVEELDTSSVRKRPFISAWELSGGPSFPFATGNEYVRNNSQIKLAFSGSVGLICQLTRKVDFSLRLCYERKGSKSEFFFIDAGDPSLPPAQVNFAQDVGLDYIGLQILPRYFVDPNRQLYVGVGTYFNFLVKETVSTYVHRNDTLISHSVSELKSDFDYKSLDWGLTVHIGYNFKFNHKTSCNIQLLANAGITEANKEMLPSTRLNSITILVGVIINNKKGML